MVGRHERLVKRICGLYGIPWSYGKWTREHPYIVLMHPHRESCVKEESLSDGERDDACLQCLKLLFIGDSGDSAMDRLVKGRSVPWGEIVSDSLNELEMKLDLRGAWA